jgi:hypothetical protein
MIDLRFAGLGDVKRIGLSVQAATERLLRLAYLEKRLMFLCAAHLVPATDHKLKLAFARFQFHAGQRSHGLRLRLREMRTPKVRIESTPAAALEVFMDEAMHLVDEREVAEVAWWLHQRSLQTYETYLAETNPLADAPTCDLIESLLPRLRQTVDWLDTYLTEIGAPAAQRTSPQRLEPYLRAAAGIDGTGESGIAPPARERSTSPFVIPRRAGRDAGLPRVWDYAKPPQEQVAEHLVYMMGIRMSEINVAEGLSIVLCETPNMPWEFYHDISRHLWDEDWADEVLHVNIARRQLADWFPGGLKELSAFAEAGKAIRAEVKARHAPVRLEVPEGNSTANGRE